MQLESEEKPENFHILLVDDEKSILNALRRVLRPMGYHLYLAQNAQEALEILETQKIDVVISDMIMPNINGAELLYKVNEKWPSTIRILLSGFTELKSIIDVINKGKIYHFISKPWDDIELRMVIEHALNHGRIKKEHDKLLVTINKRNAELQNEIRLRINIEEQMRREKRRFQFESYGKSGMINAFIAEFKAIISNFTDELTSAKASKDEKTILAMVNNLITVSEQMHHVMDKMSKIIEYTDVDQKQEDQVSLEGVLELLNNNCQHLGIEGLNLECVNLYEHKDLMLFEKESISSVLEQFVIMVFEMSHSKHIKVYISSESKLPNVEEVKFIVTSLPKDILPTEGNLALDSKSYYRLMSLPSQHKKLLLCHEFAKNIDGEVLIYSSNDEQILFCLKVPVLNKEAER